MKSGSYLERSYIKDSAFIWQKVSDEVLLVPVHKKADDVDGIYALEEVAAYIWELLEPENTLRQIGERVIEEFDVKPEQAEADLLAFIEQLESIGAARSV